jgi:tetratricopeptide (TPR) repeat protein
MKRRLKEFVRTVTPEKPHGSYLMPRKARKTLLRFTPAWIKVMVAQFGVAAVISAAALFLACFGLLVLTAISLPPRTGWLITGLGLLLESWALWRLRGFRLLGQILCACGCVRENLSQFLAAKWRFVGALKFLADRQKAYEGLSRIADTESDLRQLAETIRAKERPVSAQLALLRGRCLRDAGDLGTALASFELANKLAPSDPTRLELAELYLSSRAADKCLQALERLTQPDSNGRSFFLRSSALQTLGQTKEALLWARRATQLRPCDPDYQLLKGRILETLGQPKAALRQYNKSIRVHPRNPEAFYHRGLLRSEAGDQEGASEDFERCCYFKNTWTEAYLLAHAAKQGTPPFPVKLAHAPSTMEIEVLQFHLEVAQVAEVKVAVRSHPGAKSCQIRVLEPFGFGLEVSPQAIDLGNPDTGQDTQLRFRVCAARPDAVNLGKPWILNFVFTTATTWANQLVQFRVADNSPGRIFLVLTDDHETSKKSSRREISPDETECDLAAKTYAAQALAEKHSLKWTHLLDTGTAISLPKWAAELSPIWSQVWRNVRACYRDGLLRGHDHQVHLHLSAVPESYFFCYSHTVPDNVEFDLQKRGRQVNSWANVVRRYGRPSDPNSRLGSLVHSAKITGSVMGQPCKPHQPLFFRAGQWDLGNCTAEREKSVMALRESFFLADSSVTEGYDCNRKPFQFGNPLSRAAYFTFRNNPEKPAQHLHDAGILEVVPILLPQGNHPVEPRDDPEVVLAAYRTLLTNGRVKPGRHLILEIEHLFSLPAPSTSTRSGESLPDVDWAAMEHHFSTLSSQCAALEGVTATEAIFSWLDYYTPELVVRLEPRACEKGSACGSRYRFSLRFLGQGILRDQERLYRLVVPIPSLGERNIKTVRILRGDDAVLERPGSPSSGVAVQLSLSTRNQGSFALELHLDEIPLHQSDFGGGDSDFDKKRKGWALAAGAYELDR